MEYILPVVAGFLISFIGTLLPGLLNMTAAKVSLKEGRTSALIFACGAATVVLVQAYIALTFAKLINRSPEIIATLEEVGVVIFGILTIYFLLFAKKGKKKKTNDGLIKKRSKTGNYFLGAMLSALNFFPIPYYVFISVSFTAYKLFEFNNLTIFLFVAGIVSAAYLVFYLYIVFFKKFQHKTEFFMRNVNYFIGAITGIIAIMTALRIIKNH